MKENNPDTALIYGLFALIITLVIFFVGEPDIHDAIIYYLMGK